jgi:integrase
MSNLGNKPRGRHKSVAACCQYPIARPRDPSSRLEVSFGTAAREWLRYIEHDRKRRPSTLRDYKHVVHSHLIPEFGESTLIGTITPARIEAYRERLVEEHLLAPRTINKILTNLYGLFRRATRAFGLDQNPAAYVDRQPVPNSGDFRVLSPPEIERLLGAAHMQDAAVFAVAAFAGLRLGEIRALRWGDVDVTHSLIHVRRSYVNGHLDLPKAGRVRSVPLIPQLAQRLLSLRKRTYSIGPDDLVFVRPGGRVLEDSRLRRRFYAALADAGLPHMRIHDLRHVFGTLAVQAFPLSDVAFFMGHRDISTTMIYVHHIPQKDAAARLARVLAPRASHRRA